MNALQYQILTEKGMDKEIIQVLEETFQNKDESTATKGDLEITKLALQKEIEVVRAEIREAELRLRKEIEVVRAEIRETELRLRKEIEVVRAEIREVELRLTKEIKEAEIRLIKEIRRSDLKMFWLLLGFLSPMYLGILSVALKVFFF